MNERNLNYIRNAVIDGKVAAIKEFAEIVSGAVNPDKSYAGDDLKYMLEHAQREFELMYLRLKR